MTTSADKSPLGSSSKGCLTLFLVGIVWITLVDFTAIRIASKQNPKAFSGPTMGTSYSIRYYGGPESEALQPQVNDLLAKINRQMSTYDPESEISRFNRSGEQDWFNVSRETADVVSLALGIAERTAGAFDPTVGPAVNLWGFGPDGRVVEAPSAEAIAAALTRIGYHNLEVRPEPPALRKKLPELYVDLSAVAKGYASDAVTELLESAGVVASMVEIGGEVRTRGTKPEGKPWQIGIEQPNDRDRRIREKLPMKNGALATSGDYRNFFSQDGVRYSHTIDPQTARPVRHSLATVSVWAETCAEADAVATALMVLGEDRGYDWCERHGVAAMFLVREADDTITQRRTSHFATRFPAGGEN